MPPAEVREAAERGLVGVPPRGAEAGSGEGGRWPSSPSLLECLKEDPLLSCPSSVDPVSSRISRLPLKAYLLPEGRATSPAPAAPVESSILLNEGFQWTLALWGNARGKSSNGRKPIVLLVSDGVLWSRHQRSLLHVDRMVIQRILYIFGPWTHMAVLWNATGAGTVCRVLSANSRDRILMIDIGHFKPRACNVQTKYSLENACACAIRKDILSRCNAYLHLFTWMASQGKNARLDNAFVTLWLKLALVSIPSGPTHVTRTDPDKP